MSLLLRTRGSINQPLNGRDLQNYVTNKHNNLVQNIFDSSDNIYYNAIVRNDTTNQFKEMTYYEERRESLLDKADDYYLSVIRLNIPTTSLPIFYFPLVNTEYSVTIVNTVGATSQQFLTYQPSGNQTSALSGFGAIAFYQQFLDMLNTALNAAHLAAGGVAGQQPFFELDRPTGLISLYARVSVYDSPIAQIGYAGSGGTFEIYCSNAVIQKLRQLDGYFFGFQQANGQDYRMYVKNNLTNGTTFSGNAYYIMTQEFSSLYNWYDLRNIVLTTGTIPVEKENSSSVDGNGNNITLPILTDFSPRIDANEPLSDIQYYPQGEYRLIDLNSSFL